MTDLFRTSTPIHILCFGDSLTKGYSMCGMNFTPYSTAMKKKLEETIGGKGELSFVVDTDGVSGQLVTNGFRERMASLYSASQTRECPYDWVVFLGGTNDLAYSISPNKIYDEIKAITDLPLATGARVLLLTVPDCSAKSAKLDRVRGELNGLLKSDARDGVFLLDLHAKIPYHGMPEKEREGIWDDGLHFAPAGYERVGNLVAQRLAEILNG
ncbi:asparagine amidase a [Diplocarpon rosae]|nr:asparagine amidase a [Diplocarpon rosae]